MDRTSWIAVILCIAALIWWNYSYTQQQAERYAEYRRHLAAAQQAAPAAAPEASLQPAAPAPADQTPPPQTERAPEQTLTVTSPGGALEYTFTSRGGIASVRLLRHLADRNSPDKFIVINSRASLPIGALFEDAWQPRDERPFTLRRAENEPAVILERPGALALTKRFKLPPSEPANDDYVTELEITWANHTPEPARLPAQFLAAGEISPIHKNDQPYYSGLDYYRDNSVRHVAVNWFDTQRIPLIGIVTREAKAVYTSEEDRIDWVGVRNQFFASILTPRDGQGAGLLARRHQLRELNGQPLHSHPLYGIEGALRLPALEIPPGGQLRRSFQLYTGPRELSRLQRLKQNEADIMNYGWFKIVSEILLHSMNGLKALTGNYATAILLLTVIIKLLLYPLQNAATIQMKRMSLLSPKINELREKYKNNPQKMNEEMMRLYREYGVNPFSGCLPMLIQIPIFFGFFSMLGTAVELRNSGFLWVQDLSQPDTVFHLGPLPVNILPLLMAATMFWQMAITPKTGDKLQQRIFLIMPVIFVIFCYNYASALALYWTAQNIFSIVQLYLTRDQPMPELKKVSAPAKVSPAPQAKRKKSPGRPGGRP